MSHPMETLIIEQIREDHPELSQEEVMKIYNNLPEL